jgi:hypothetical protein
MWMLGYFVVKRRLAKKPVLRNLYEEAHQPRTYLLVENSGYTIPSTAPHAA